MLRACLVLCLPADCVASEAAGGLRIELESFLLEQQQRINGQVLTQGTHSIVLLRQHTVLLSPTADRHRQRDGRRASMARSAFAKMDQPRNLFRILNGTTVRAELAATAQAKHA